MVLCLLGCGGADSPVPAAGMVRLDDKPLADATVIFDHQTTKHTVYLGITDSEGRYSLQNADGSSEGAPVGTYRISVKNAKPLTAGKIDESTRYSPELVPPQYRDGTQQFTVPVGGTTDANFDLKSR